MAEEYESVKALKLLQQNIDRRIYNSVMFQAKKDMNFERLIQAMTIDRIAGKSVLAKGKAKFEK